MRIHSIGSGHAKLIFKRYYTAVMTLAEAPEVHADPSSQPGDPQHPGPSQGQPQQQPGQAQQQPGHIQAMDVDQAGDDATSDVVRTMSKDDKVGPHMEKYRWRLMSFEILPGITSCQVACKHVTALHINGVQML